MDDIINLFHRRDGVSQNRRASEALDPAYAPVDGRTLDELRDFLHRIAALIRFVGENELPPYEAGGDWQAFFPSAQKLKPLLEKARATGDLAPHLALEEALLHTYQIFQKDLDQLTQKHLQHFYENILGIAPRPALPDRVHVSFELNKNSSAELVKKGTLLDAGKDRAGNPLHYALEHDLVVNQGKVSSIKTLMVDNFGRIFAAPKANAGDGLETPLPKMDPSWATFGEEQSRLPANSRTMIDAELGIAFASSNLYLKDGERTIELTLQFEPWTPELEANIKGIDFAKVLEASFSTNQGWEKVIIELTQIKGAPDFTITFTIKVGSSFSAIVPYQEKVQQLHLNTALPVLRFIYRQKQARGDYLHLRKLKLKGHSISATVVGSRAFILQHQGNVIDPSRSFRPFGTAPTLGANLLLGSEELYLKTLKSLKLNITWDEETPEKFTEYYKNWEDKPADNISFKAKVSMLEANRWTELNTASLFNQANAQQPISISVQKFQPSLLNFTSLNEPIKQWSPNSASGWLKLELAGQDFGHSAYSKALEDAATKKKPEEKEIKEPFAPIVKSLEVEYESDSNEGQVFHIEPFGNYSLKMPATFLPDFSRGNLYIGLQGISPPETISLLMQFKEGSTHPLYSLAPEMIQWHYLAGEEWLPSAQDAKGSDFPKVMDTTEGLQRSGIIALIVSEVASIQHSRMPPGQFWLRASIRPRNEKTESESEYLLQSNPRGVARLEAMLPQAMAAVLANPGQSAKTPSIPLPSNTIKDLLTRQVPIKSVQQAFSSLPGMDEESGLAYFRRVAELLRHKDRAISRWDYERLLLAQFPEIYRAKCIPFSQGFDFHHPGAVMVVVIPDFRGSKYGELLEPSFSPMRLREMRSYLQQRSSPSIQVEVLNALYESITVSGDIRFRPGYDPGFYLQQLNRDMIEHLSPWVFDQDQELSFGGQIYRSVLIDFIENREYVDYVLNLTMSQEFENGGIGVMQVGRDPQRFVVGSIATNLQVARPSTPRAVLISARQHHFKAIL
jgi:hypothetical protein